METEPHNNVSPSNADIDAAPLSASAPRTLSGFGAWALGFGCIIGWGSFVMPSTTFLPNAGPAGTAIAFAVGAVIMAIIAVSYRFMMEHHPVAGGPFVFAHETFGHVHGFICGWFLLLAFMPLVAVNITAISLLSRNLMSTYIDSGFAYSLAGYQVNFAEIAIDLIILTIFAILLARSNRIGYILQSIFVVCMLLFLAAMVAGSAPYLTIENIQPLVSPTKQPVSGVLVVLSTTPWAFVGFDAISQGADDLSFSVRRAGIVMVAAIAMGSVVYTMGTAITAAVTPDGYATWADYIAVADELSGIAAVPLFNAITILFGKAAAPMIVFAVLGAIFSGVVGFAIASSRVIWAMASAGHLPAWLAERDPRRNTPKNAIYLTFVVAAAMTLLGRSVLTWIMNISSIGAALSFFYTCAAAARIARAERRPLHIVLGVAGVLFSVIFVLLLVLPIPQIGSQLQVESLVFLTAWIALGLNFYTPSYEKRRRMNLDEHLTLIDSE